MKPITESPETFAAYATIDAGYYMIKEMKAEMDKDSNRSPIERMVDDASGFQASRNRLFAEKARVIMEDIIEAKKVIEADYSKDEEFLKGIIELIDGK